AWEADSGEPGPGMTVSVKPRVSFEQWWAHTGTAFPLSLAAADGVYAPVTVPVGACVDNSWKPIAVGAPDAIVAGLTTGSQAVWTGTEMIVVGDLGRSVRYRPSTDTWTSIAADPSGSESVYRTVVWTGRLIVVWGGGPLGQSGTGGRYDPSTDSWTSTSRTNAPDSREYHTALSTGSDMIA